METEKMIIEMNKFSSEDITIITTILMVMFSIWAIFSIVYTIKSKIKQHKQNKQTEVIYKKGMRYGDEII